MKTQTTIVIAEDHKLIRAGYVKLLSERTDFKVTGEAANGKELLDLLESKQPDIILLDLEMPVMSGGEAHEEIRKRYPAIRTIIVSSFCDDNFVCQYFLRGVNAYLPKNSDPEQLLEAIDAVVAENYYLSKPVSQMLLAGMLKDKQQRVELDQMNLTTTELKIIKMLCEEKTSKAIAEELGTTSYVVDHQRRSIQTKTQQHSSIGLFKFALKNGIVSI